MKAPTRAFTSRRTRNGYLGFVLLALIGLLAACMPVGAEQVPYRMDASNQAGWWKPIDEFGGNVYVAYDAWGRSGAATDTHTVYVARRDSSGAWVRGYLPAADGGPATFPDDIGHNQPTIALDGDGYIHVFASMHNSGWRYYRSSRPGDPTSMVNRSSEMPDQGGRFTYPNGLRTPNGDIYLIIRNFPVGRFYRWNNTSNTWSAVATFANEPNYVVYPDDVTTDASGNVHIAWEWSYGGAGGLRHLGSEMRYEPATGRFFDAAGRQLTTPVGINSTAVYQPLEPGERSTDRSSDINPPGFQSAKLAIDPATGYPMAVYRMRLTNGGRFQVRYAAWDGTAWRRQTVYAGKYTTYAAIDVTIHGGQPRVYYAKTGVPNGNQAFASVRQPDGRWVEDPPLLPGALVERLAVVQRGAVDWVYLSAPAEMKLYLDRIALT
jgi:putative BNR repeat neuraminidase